MRNAALTIAFLCFASHAHAHMISTGVGPFYDGFTHLFATPADLLAVLGLSLVGGLGGPLRARAVLLATLAGWAVGIAVGAVILESEWRPLILFPALIVPIGLAIAADHDLPIVPLTGIVVPIALLFGISSGAGLRSMNYPLQLGAGVIAGVLITASLATALAVPRPNHWQRIALRIAGSWIAAIGLMTMAGELHSL